MMRILSGLSMFLFILCGSSLALDRNAFSFTRYNLEVQLHPARQAMHAKGTVILRNDSTTPQHSLVLQISSTLKWQSVFLAGKAVPYITQQYISDIDHTGALSEAIVTLPQDLAPQATAELEVSYSGTVPANSARLTRIGTPPDIAARSDWDRVSMEFTAIRGVGYVAWYPMSTEAASLSDGNVVFDTIAAWKERQASAAMRVRLSVVAPSGNYQIIANDNAKAGSGRVISAQRTSWIDLEFEPLGRRVPSFAAGVFETKSSPGLLLHYLLGHEVQATVCTELAQKIAPSLARWFGPPKLRTEIVDLPDPHLVPYETEGLFFTPLNTDNTQQLELTLAHQLTHAAFQSFRPWMYEGLAHFAQALEREQQGGQSQVLTSSGQLPPSRRAAIAYMDQQLPPLVAAEYSQLPQAPHTSNGAPPKTPVGQPLITATDEVFFRTKAMFVWWMLRDMVGDRALQRAIQSYRSQDDKQPAYFQHLLEAEAHRSLEWFFDDWVYRDRGLADFHVVAAYPRALLPSDYSVTVTVANGGGAGAEVPVTVHAAHGDVDRRVEVRAHETAVVRMPVPDVPREAVVNDGSVPEYNMKNDRTAIQLPPQSNRE